MFRFPSSNLCSDVSVADVTRAAANRASVVPELPHQQSSSVFPAAAGAPASIRLAKRFSPTPPAASSGPLCFLYPLSPRTLGPSLCPGSFAGTRTPLVRQCHGAPAWHRFVRRLAAGLAHCADGLDPLPSSFPSSPPCPTLSVCVTACSHPPSAGRKRKHTNKRFAGMKGCCLSPCVLFGGFGGLGLRCFGDAAVV